MDMRGAVFEWQMLEEDGEWPGPTALSSSGGSKSRRLGRRRKWWTLAVLLVALLPASVGGYREVRRADQEMTRVENQVRAAVTAETWTRQHQVQSAGTTVVAQTGLGLNTQTPGLEVRRVEVRGDYAMVEAWTNESDVPWLLAPYRETRFYYESDQGWLPTEPLDTFWLPERRLQAGRFTFVYGPRDTDAVLGALRRIEEVDAALRQEFGLPASDETLTLKLVATLLPSLDPVDLARLSDGTTLYAPSPALLPLPASISEGDALLQLISGLLVKRDLDEALAGSERVCNWQPLVNGLRKWLLREHSALPSAALYNDERLFRIRLEHGTSPRLSWLGPSQTACSSGQATRGRQGTSANDSLAAALVGYAVSAYGRGRLPALIDAIHRYNTWEDLIPAVYGASTAEFEAGWQDYLRTTDSSAPAK